MKAKWASAGVKFISVLALGLSLAAAVGIEGARACSTNNNCSEKSGK